MHYYEALGSMISGIASHCSNYSIADPGTYATPEMPFV